MSADLWRHFLQNDVDAFRHFLANATYTAGGAQRPTYVGSAGQKTGSPAGPGFLAVPPPKSRKSSAGTNSQSRSQEGKPHGHPGSLTRGDINSKDVFGRTILHLAASSTQDGALDFVNALLKIPFLDLYVQDTESGWTALHRALYFGNVAIAQALMLRDIKDATDYTTSGLHGHAGGLIKIKDHEGNSPFEVFGLTIAPRMIAEDAHSIAAHAADDESGNSIDLDQMGSEESGQRRSNKARVNLSGDEVFAFGSNKNLSLGLGDEDDRQYPERIVLQRPEHLLRRLHHEHVLAKHEDLSLSQRGSMETPGIPALIQYQTLKVQDVVMSKLHTAVITSDPEANLFMCGFGPGGRLGTGDEITRFNYVCIETGGLAGKRVATVALGQDHSIAVSVTGEVFTWGSSKYGQLGYSLPQSAANETSVQLTPRQLFGPMKKEAIVGAAASSIHSVICTASALYTFGKNEGQLGLMDADARSLEVQVMPRRVGVSVLQSAIEMVSAIDRATTILLESHDVIVLTHFGFTKILFQLEGFTNYFLQGSFATRYDPAGNFIRKVTSGGNTICAMSSFGEVFTLDVTNKVDAASVGVSTTNPSKARNALPHPTKVWSIRKSHMAARDVAVGQYGSIILATEAGSVWRKEKRAIIKDVGSKISGAARAKDYKFVRIPNITRAVAVRSNAFAAFTAIRKDCHVTQEQITIDPPSLWGDLLPLLPFSDYGNIDETSDTEDPQPRFWKPATSGVSPALIRRAVLLSRDAQADLHHLFSKHEPLADSQYDLWITSNATDVRIPVHAFVVKSRSNVLRRALTEFQTSYYFSFEDVFSVEYGEDGQIQIQFKGADFLTILNLAFYLYTDNVIDVWHHTSREPRSVTRHWQKIRADLMKIANNLDLKSLERAARIMTEPAKCLQTDMDIAFDDEDFFSDADLIIELADDIERPAHISLLCCRCPFFDGLFHGRASGAWISSRRTDAEDSTRAVRVDLKHIDADIFEMVLRHIYADTGEELFDDVVSKTLDEFLDLVVEVLSVANELMLQRLAQICQKVIGKFVTTRNICQLLNIVAPCSVNEYKHAGLEYICLNLESMLEHRLLEELDEDLLVELGEIVRENQLAFLPFAKSGRADAELLEKHAYLAGQLEQARERRIDSMQLRSRLHEDEGRSGSFKKFRVGSLDRNSSSPLTPRTNRTSSRQSVSPGASPSLLPEDAGSDLLFEMDDERTSSKRRPARSSNPASNPVSPDLRPLDHESHLEDGTPTRREDEWFDAKGRPLASSLDMGPPSLGSSFPLPQYSGSPSMSRTPNTTTMTTGFGTKSTPWSNVTSTPTKTELRDIMAEASVTRPSNLTLAMNAKISETAKGVQKLSQKERKKMQQQQLQKQKDVQPPAPPVLPSQEESPAMPKSPWQASRPSSKQGSTEFAFVGSPVRDTKMDQVTRPPMRAAMTMRQTVARTPPPSRSVSTPITPSSKPVPPQIKSIRHNTTSSSSNLSELGSSSMADILSQQQMQKIAVKEAVAKRSLQEIQQQQEFEEWFDSESRRLQEEEAQISAAAAAATRDSRGKRGRGRGGHRNGSGRGGTKQTGAGLSTSPTVARGENTSVSAVEQAPRDAPRHPHRGRGGRRG